MGLCKCPKRKVTNLFCFEHRVNVCEHCLIDNHPKCVVKSYLNWLKDSDYNPNCALCNIPLTDGEVVRLLCYDVFHVQCLEKLYRSFPSNTAPAGYRCYSCDSPVFPTPNQAGYVTERLREILSKYNWARVGLCLPLIDEPKITAMEDETSDYITDRNDDDLHGSIIPAVDSFTSTLDAVESNISTPKRNILNEERFHHPLPSSTSLSMNIITNDEEDDTKAVSRKFVPEPLSHKFSSINFPSEQDPDGPDKYKRRSAWSWLKRWLKSRMLRGRSHRDSRSLLRRTTIIFVIGLIALLTFIVFATRAGRRSSSNDPNFDPMLNPNIHVARARVVPADLGVGNLDQPDQVMDPLENLRPIETR